ncbi:carboxymethylenebutenolidase [Sphingobium indicum]|uniref:Carboxymethylenebutenolidase n=3 Tax=Sphingobium indicum TaxID=332055 RepID=A0A8E0WRM3_9SPHN|nr:MULTISPECIES: dienelactone hydrolase family protein [Sphingobium]EPR18864.1 carboxymethylenebutenolidase [Sphingobium indicum IP26]KEY98696.1 carboxymethylenebutenolidase [Sphingomonas sp. BHC-A]APL95465.1 carboxymethylenebutenolidase [Sphingobium indicum B90A]EQA98093.1 carboxymethylenebutenolidase [Sphingobium sp. HDIP04]KER35940.1 carboxymethylenebutenolidase [Sphingobium indicum F2]
MTITRRVTVHEGPGGRFESMAVFDDAAGAPRPGVLLFPNVLGAKEADFAYAERVAALGLAVLVADMFGQGKRTTRADPDMGRYMAELNDDRALLRDRANAAHALLKSLDETDESRTAAIGFCFGGKCVLDLARSGADIAGGVSFHGVYDAPPFPHAKITARLLICHGWNDPIAPPEATVALAKELTEAGCDWQIHAYGHAGHAFTDHDAKMPERGLAYHPDADRRSFRSMADFLDDVFG